VSAPFQGLGHWGVWALAAAFIVVTLESSAFLGLLFPGETVALAIGALSGAGVLHFWWALAVVAAGAISGDIGGYALGRWKGDALLARWTFARRQHERHRRQVESYFARWGAATVLIGRFVAIGRAFAPFTAGLYEMPARRFLPIAVVAGVLWGAVIVTSGYLLGAKWRLVETWMRSLGLGVLALLVLTLLALLLWRWLLHRQDQLRAAWQRHVAERYGVKLEPLLAFIRARLSPTGYLGLHLTVGVLVIGALAWLFGGVVQDIFAQDPLVRVDRTVALFIAEHRTAALDSVMAVPAFFGNAWWLVSMVALTAAALAYAGEKALALAALPILGGAYGIALALCGVFSWFSPDVPASRLVHGFHSFPSIAMIMATTAYGISGYALATHGWGWRWQTLGAVAALYVVLLIGLETVYRDQLLSAVIGGFAAGGCWLAICMTGILTYQKLQTLGTDASA
jgi:membrane protein DedA with SNARE-associated domain